MREPEAVMTDQQGDQWWNFMFEYHWEGREYGFEICARSRDEAEARLKKIPLSRFVGQMDGQPIPAAPGTGLYVRFATWWRNLSFNNT